MLGDAVDLQWPSSLRCVAESTKWFPVCCSSDRRWKYWLTPMGYVSHTHSYAAESNVGPLLRDAGLTLCHKPSRVRFPTPDGVLSKHYRGAFEADRGLSQPDRIVSQQDRSAPLARSEHKKPSSSFDLAIDNYLKDFGYGNQG
ncbi:uncharacterized protein LOC108151174 [Drosophila miranda]|uniref:uncharacterized protein LOC108151174 n=1 Tax=Drosophila miranda TaxID=7229 RepID=UPI0007E7E55C|nr:uncharacterized protein LOC108151174 [Drosophila miranda]